MNKKELTKKVSENLQGAVNADSIKIIFDECLSVIKATIQNKETVEIRGFGVFSSYQRKQRKARDISRGKQIIVPAKRVVHFNPSKDFKL